MENEDGSEIANGSTEQNKQYIEELINERQNINASFVHAARLLDLEISQAQSGHEKVKLLELHNDKPTRVILKVKVPANEYPKFNFIGKIIGPKGNSLKRIQESTECRMSVFGRGSMRDKDKEEEMRQHGGKYAHLNDELHVHVETFGHPIDVYRRLSFALHELRRHLVPDYNDEVTQRQVEELTVLKGSAPGTAGRGRGRGTPSSTMRGGSFPGQGNMTGGRGGAAGVSRQGAATTSPKPNPAPQTPITDFSEAYQYEVGQSGSFTTEGFDARNADNSTASVTGARSMNQPNVVSGFNSQADNAYDMNVSGIWGNNSGSYQKPPLPRSSIFQARSHPYAPH